jgi:hypothetical protein
MNGVCPNPNRNFMYDCLIEILHKNINNILVIILYPVLVRESRKSLETIDTTDLSFRVPAFGKYLFNIENIRFRDRLQECDWKVNWGYV